MPRRLRGGFQKPRSLHLPQGTPALQSPQVPILEDGCCVTVTVPFTLSLHGSWGETCLSSQHSHSTAPLHPSILDDTQFTGGSTLPYHSMARPFKGTRRLPEVPGHVGDWRVLPFFLQDTVQGIGHGVNGSGTWHKAGWTGHCQTHVTKERSKASGDSGQPKRGRGQAALEEKGKGQSRGDGASEGRENSACT